MIFNLFGKGFSDFRQSRRTARASKNAERRMMRDANRDSGKKRHAEPPLNKPKTEIEFPYIEGSGDMVVSKGIVLIFVSLLLPYQMWNLGVPSESPSLFSGLSMIFDLPGNIDYILWTIEEGGLVQYVIGLELMAPTVFLITAILAVKYRGSEKLASYRKSEGDNLAVVRIVGKFHLFYFAASIIAMLIYYRNDILLGATQLLPIDDGDPIGNWGLGFWLGGLSG
ncbi:uncharacterized protein METZ01_LOCUS173748, partial [marine metagenome]